MRERKKMEGIKSIIAVHRDDDEMFEQQMGELLYAEDGWNPVIVAAGYENEHWWAIIGNKSE
jgi:hypothetical protein